MMPNFFGRNIWNESTIRIHFSTAKGGKDIWHPKRTEVSCRNSQGRSPIWLFCSFGLQPQRYRHLQGLGCMEMNNINGYNKTKQQTESEFNFHHVKNFVSPMIHSFQFDLEILQINFQTLRELRSLHRNHSHLRFTQSGFEVLAMIKCCLQPTQMLPSTDSIQFSFQQVPDFCNIFYKILARFFA